jgi:CheY-like chemotaxis protein
MKMREILIADDDPGLRQTLKLALEAAGYHVRVAAHGGEAVSLQQEKPADVLITDIFMPESDGFEAIDRFRQAFPATKIIAMSGDARRARREYLPVAALIGVDATLKKPFKTDELLQALRSLAAGAR